jgi:hypothetical protein
MRPPFDTPQLMPSIAREIDLEVVLTIVAISSSCIKNRIGKQCNFWENFSLVTSAYFSQHMRILVAQEKEWKRSSTRLSKYKAITTSKHSDGFRFSKVCTTPSFNLVHAQPYFMEVALRQVGSSIHASASAKSPMLAPRHG